jgi:hypothetical protein
MVMPGSAVVCCPSIVSVSFSTIGFPFLAR